MEGIDLGVKGDPADSRMRAAALRRGVKLVSISRPVRPSDFNDFDYILAMDRKNRGGFSSARLTLQKGRFTEVLLFSCFGWRDMWTRNLNNWKQHTKMPF